MVSKSTFRFSLLSKSDIGLPLFNLLSQLSPVPFKDESIDIEKSWKAYISDANLHSIVIYCESKLIGFGTIFIEHKIRNSRVGHIEDIVIDKNFRAQKLGYKLINKLLEIAFDHDCYKTTLNCYDENLGFYKKLGFKTKGNQMDYFYNEH